MKILVYNYLPATVKEYWAVVVLIFIDPLLTKNDFSKNQDDRIYNDSGYRILFQ